MELLEILDEKGNKTGKKAPIEEIYDKGYWHKSVHIWIINDNHELLMQRRNPTKKTFPDMWAISVAGHVRCYEDSVAAGLRELNEEIDAHLKKEDLEYLFTVRREQKCGTKTLRVFDDVYLVHLDVDIVKTKLQVEELIDLKYIYYEYLEEMLKVGDQTYVPYCEEHEKLFKELRKRYK